MAVDLNSISVGVPAKAMTLQLKTVAERSKVRRAIDLGSASARRRGDDFGLNTTGTALDGSINNTLSEWRDKSGASGGVSGYVIAVRERNRYVRRQASAAIQNSKRGAVTGHHLARQEKNARVF